MTRPPSDAPRSPATPARRTRIRAANEERILEAALEVFAQFGFHGASIDEIARGAGMSKPNLLYYFRTKQDIYEAILNRILELWLKPFAELRADGDPEAELSRYIRSKMEYSRTRPRESRLFAGEILQGAPILRPVLETRVRSLVEQKAAVIRAWTRDGRIADVDPVHLVFLIWAATQHYADFAAQITAVLGDTPDEEVVEAATRAITNIVLRGLLPR